MKTSIIGFGHLGKALARGLLASGSVSAADISVCARSSETLQAAREEFGFGAFSSVTDAIRNAEVIFLVVKGHVFENLADEFRTAAPKDSVVVSLMAGVTSERLVRLTGKSGVVRAMPSIAIADCTGVIGYTSAPEAVTSQFQKLGFAFEVPESDIEKVTAFSACGLGFAAYLLDAFSKAGENIGFSREICEKITAQTFKNAIAMSSYPQTVKAVATKGGATEQGVLHMDACGVYSAVSGAVRSAYEKMTR